MDLVMETTSIRFADAARHLGEEARRQGLVVPAFRSPPRCSQHSRSIRRRRDGGATVSVALRGRPWPAVLADLIEGVIAANRLEGRAAAAARDGLWLAVAASPAGAAVGEPAGIAGGGGVPVAGAGRPVPPAPLVGPGAAGGSEGGADRLAGRRLEAA
jgi:hypothetical protein